MTDIATPTGATAEGITQPGSADEQAAIDAARVDEAARKKLEAEQRHDETVTKICLLYTSPSPRD